jgi:type II secretion system protein C
VVWDRDLFAVSRPAEQVARREKIAVDKIALAGTDVGLKLIGTAVANDPKLNYAIIDVASARNQEIFREKDRVGKAVIKAILRNNVIIETEDGRRMRLTIDEKLEKNQKTAQTRLEIGPESAAASFNPAEIQSAGGTFQVAREAIPSSPSDIRRVIEELSLTPQINEGKIGGFSVGRLRAKDILSRIGLRTGDIIKGVDDDEFNAPEDLEFFFQRLARAGDLAVVVERRGRLQKLNVIIE